MELNMDNREVKTKNVLTKPKMKKTENTIETTL